MKASLSMRGGSLAVGLFISRSSGLWSVANLNFGAPSSYICSLVVVSCDGGFKVLEGFFLVLSTIQILR